jgi:RNA polymerase sigma-70 factor (ECF subfamily)
VTEDQFRSAFLEHQHAVYRFLWRMTGPEAAEDLAQEVFLALLRNPERFDPSRGTLRTFLLAIARNLALKRWRNEHQFVELDDERCAASPFDDTGRETAELVAAAVRALPPLQREAIVLAEYEQCSLDEIARMVSTEVGTVKSRLHRARENLRRMLAPLRASVKSETFEPVNGR